MTDREIVHFAYIRVSLGTQDFQRQKFLIREYLDLDPKLIKWFSDKGTSGSRPIGNRRGLVSCLKAATLYKQKSGVGNLVISDISRLSRNPNEIKDFFKSYIANSKLRLIVADIPDLENNSYEFQMQIIMQKALEAESYRNEVSNKTKQALDAKKSEIRDKGFFVSKSGRKVFKLGIHDNIDAARQKAGEVVSDNADLFAKTWYKDIKYRIDAGQSYRTIAQEFNARGFKTARNGSWYASTISNIVKRGGCT